MLQTKTKIAGARVLYNTFRRFGVAPPAGQILDVRRGGINWNLDLAEGIDFSIFLLGAFEPGTARAIRSLAHPGDTVFDIGANIGAHTLPLAKAVGASGRVFAFEATDFAFHKLEKNLSLNAELQSRVIATQVVLVDKPGLTAHPDIYSSWPLQPGPDAHPKHLGRRQTTLGAQVSTLDEVARDLNITKVELIKLDVDGHEYPVLKGARETISKFLPTIVMELSPYVHAEEGNSFDAFLELLKDWNYSLKALGADKPVPLDSAYLNRVIPDGGSVNVVATVGK
jgi:FkbM family methyltransferase